MLALLGLLPGCVLVASWVLLSAQLGAEVVRLEITDRQLVLEGRSFGDVGA